MFHKGSFDRVIKVFTVKYINFESATIYRVIITYAYSQYIYLKIDKREKYFGFCYSISFYLSIYLNFNIFYEASVGTDPEFSQRASAFNLISLEVISNLGRRENVPSDSPLKIHVWRRSPCEGPLTTPTVFGRNHGISFYKLNNEVWKNIILSRDTKHHLSILIYFIVIIRKY